jgi:hypothetical protein
LPKIPWQSSDLEQHRHSVRHCEAHMKIPKIKKNSTCRGNLLNWNKMPDPVRHCEEFRVPMAIGIAEHSAAISRFGTRIPVSFVKSKQHRRFQPLTSFQEIATSPGSSFLISKFNSGDSQ